jgi:hypothetical protein
MAGNAEILSTLEGSTLFQKHPDYRKALQVASVPERVIQFRVVWEDDNGEVCKHLYMIIPELPGAVIETDAVASEQRVPCSIQLRSWAVQRRSTFPPNW